MILAARIANRTPGAEIDGELSPSRMAIDKDFPVEAAFIFGRCSRLARGSAGESDNSANLRSAANAQMHIVGF
jgi:hypothetical protein